MCVHMLYIYGTYNALPHISLYIFTTIYFPMSSNIPNQQVLMAEKSSLEFPAQTCRGVRETDLFRPFHLCRQQLAIQFWMWQAPLHMPDP